MRGSGAWLYFVAWGASLAVLIALSCSATLRRRWPQNMFALAAFTACEALLVGTITAYHDTTVVMLAFLATGAAVAGKWCGGLMRSQQADRLK